MQENGRNWFKTYIDKVAWELEHFKPNSAWDGGNGPDVVLIVGMPAKGGVVSMTLKNQYKQITSRTVEYDFLDQEPRSWYGRSAEKMDPTHYSWRVVSNPTFSGRPRGAANRSMRSGDRLGVVIKNGPFNSVAELRKVRSSSDFENIGAGKGSSEGMRTVAALAGAFANSTVRLEAGDESAERAGGWELAADEVQSVGPGIVSGRHSNWENGQWRGHVVRFLTGRLRGEAFPVRDNTRVALQVRDEDARRTPESVPGGLALTPSAGDLFSVGPGYATPLCYARSSGADGSWTWRGRIPLGGAYDLYIFGLNDSISTTEFLEENHNASLDVYVWNFRSQEYDRLCEREKYSKEDCFRAGRISADHVSGSGDFKLRLVTHDVTEDNAGLNNDQQTEMVRVERRRSGYAWFNYAVLTPVPVIGRVNVNTAGERLLASLPGIDATLARNIKAGIDNRGTPGLKPYTSLGDLLKVKGMTMDVFARCANLVMLDSSTYTVGVEAQTFNATAAPEPASEERIGARQRMRYIVETVPGGGDYRHVRLLERTRL